MFIKRKVFLVLVVSLVSFVAHGQVGTVSPYSRYGYGEIRSQAFSGSDAMGGLGYGMRNSKHINSMNPASYTSIDSLTFMLDLGVSGTINGLYTNSSSANIMTAAVDYLAIQVPLAKWAAMSFGLSPITSVGYKYSFKELKNPGTINDTLTVEQSFSGTGGITQVYLGFSFDIYDRVAIGVNGKYMFGNIQHLRQIEFPYESYYTSTTQSEDMYISAWNVDFGVQYHQPIGKDILVVGATYGLQLPMNNTTKITTTTTTTVVDDTKYAFDYPQTLGVGASYKIGSRYLFGFDFSWQNFAAVKYYDEVGAFQDRFSYAAGFEYTHRLGSKRYVDNMQWRVGANYSNSVIAVNSHFYDEMNITMGIGFPMPNSKTALNLLMIYGRRGGINTTGLLEQYFRFGLSVSLNENWFFKRKLK